MKSLGLDWYEMTANEPKSEKHFEYWDETDRKTQKCKIPYGLSVIEKPRYRANHKYADWLARQRNVSWKTWLCDDIDKRTMERIIYNESSHNVCWDLRCNFRFETPPPDLLE